MSNVKLVFYPKNSTGSNKGDYEMFIDFDCSAAPSSMVFELPASWSAKAIKLYQATINPAGKVIPDPQKNLDKGQLSSGNLTKYQAVFGGNLPAGFFFDPPSSTLISTGQTDGYFEFLVWIEDGTDNDYLDPGIKNRK